MSGWSVFWAGVKGLFCPGTSMFLEISGLALNKVNTVLAEPDVAERVKKVHDVVAKAYDILNRYSDWCPNKWRNDYTRVLAAVQAVLVAFDDGKLGVDELTNVVTKFKVAYAEWNA